MKTSELTGAALDWAVMVCEGYVQPNPIGWIVSGHFQPSTNWAQGGPIIEREGIALAPEGRTWLAVATKSPEVEVPHLYGPTPLIAAMRCYVASKLGDTIDIPQELL